MSTTTDDPTVVPVVGSGQACPQPVPGCFPIYGVVLIVFTTVALALLFVYLFAKLPSGCTPCAEVTPCPPGTVEIGTGGGSGSSPINDPMNNPNACGNPPVVCDTTLGLFCNNGVCVCGGLNEQQCGGPTSACVNTSNDSNHCGTSCVVCPAFTKCVDGECVCAGDQVGSGIDAVCTDFQIDPQNCGRATAVCSPGTACCSGVCTDLLGPSSQANANCGGCNNPCPSGFTCCNASCVNLMVGDGFGNLCGSCTAPFCSGTCCGGFCYTPETTPQFCGYTSLTCASDNVTLTATGTTTNCLTLNESCCAGACVGNFSSDPLNCGSCGVLCPSNTTCCEGNCVTFSSLTDCGECGANCTTLLKAARQQAIANGDNTISSVVFAPTCCPTQSVTFALTADPSLSIDSSSQGVATGDSVTLNTTQPGSPYQLFGFDLTSAETGPGSTITSFGQCLDVPGNNFTAFQLLQWDTCTGASTQLFAYDATTQQLSIGGYCVDTCSNGVFVANQPQLCLQPCSASPDVNQEFTATPIQYQCADLGVGNAQQTSTLNCGSCGRSCSGSLPNCCNGECVNFQTNSDACGGCGITCPIFTQPEALALQLSCCSGTCTDVLFDIDNCSACGTACTPILQVLKGAGTTVVFDYTQCCDGVCSSLASDPNNCGGCSTFAIGANCLSLYGSYGICCGGACFDGRSDVNNCGSCNNVCAAGEICCYGQCQPGPASTCPYVGSNSCFGCPTGQICINGACQCPSGTTNCSGSCIDTTDTDASNCGGCSAACPADDYCSAGNCFTTVDTGGTFFYNGNNCFSVNVYRTCPAGTPTSSIQVSATAQTDTLPSTPLYTTTLINAKGGFGTAGFNASFLPPPNQLTTASIPSQSGVIAQDNSGSYLLLPGQYAIAATNLAICKSDDPIGVRMQWVDSSPFSVQYILNSNTGLAVDDANGTTVQLQATQSYAPSTTTGSQVFETNSTLTGPLTSTYASTNGECLTASGSHFAVGVVLDFETCTNIPGQEWIYNTTTSQLTTDGGQYCLDTCLTTGQTAAAGQQLCLRQCSPAAASNPNQMFTANVTNGPSATQFAMNVTANNDVGYPTQCAPGAASGTITPYTVFTVTSATSVAFEVTGASYSSAGVVIYTLST